MKILAFAPYSYIWPHSFPEAIFLRLIKEHGASVHYLSCGGVLNDFCVPMNSAGLTITSSKEKKSSICQKCTLCAADITSWGNFEHSKLSDYSTKSDWELICRDFDTFDIGKIFEFVYEGIPLGRILSYDFLVRYKLSSKKIPPEAEPAASLQLKQTILLYKSITKLLDQVQPDRIIVYNSYYLANSVAVAIAGHRNISVYSLHSGMHASEDMYKYLIVGKTHSYRWIKDVLKFWPERRSLPVNQNEAKIITDHVVGLLKGTSFMTYSDKLKHTSSIRKTFPIPDQAKVILMTLSSSDELFAFMVREGIDTLPNSAFASQEIWLEEVIKFVKGKRDLFLIIRPHPREFPNKRESRKSENAIRLQKTLELLPDNVAVNWPEQKLSIYEVIDEVDLVLNGWSSAGKEIAFFGIPVVTHTPEALYYSEELCYSARSSKEYFEKLEIALRTGWSAEQILRGYRWYAMETRNALLSIEKFYAGRKSWRTHKYFLIFSALFSKLGLNLDAFIDLPRKWISYRGCDDAFNLVSRNLNTVLELDENDFHRRVKANTEEELSIIKNSLKEIMLVKYPSNTSTSPLKPLQKRLKEFCSK